jgi:hypothetical protein
LPHCFFVEAANQAARGGERSIDPHRQIADQAFIDRKLAIRE